MAKVSAPLFSQTAQGNLAKGALQFRGGLGGSQVYRPKAPSLQNQQPASARQHQQRARFAGVCKAWQALSPQEKQTYHQQAQTWGNGNGWQYFVALKLAKSPYPADFLLTQTGSPVVTDNHAFVSVD